MSPKLTIFCTDFHRGKAAMSFFFTLQCHVRHLFSLGSSFFASQPSGAEIEKQVHWQILVIHRHLPVPVQSALHQECNRSRIMITDTREPPGTPGHLWPLWALQESGLPCKVLWIPQAARREDVIPHSTLLRTSPSPWFRS